MVVPFLALSQEHYGYKENFRRVFESLLHASDFIQGKSVKAFENELSDCFGSQFVQSCANGTDAILLSLLALRLKKDDEVLVPSFTYAASAEPVVLLGLNPVFVDVDLETFTIDIQDLKNKISSKSKAIIPVHLFGQCCNMEPLIKVADEYNLSVIEDNAQSLGSKWKNEGEEYFTGTVGDLGTNSFFPSKNLGGFGDGGAVFCKTEEAYLKIKMLASHGQGSKYHHEIVGVNSRLDTLQAALLSVKLSNFKVSTDNRKHNASLYNKILSDCNGIVTPKVPAYSGHSYNQYTIRVLDGKRDALKDYLKENEIDSMVYYPKPLHLQPAFNAHKSFCPNSEILSSELLSIPIHPALNSEQIAYVSQKIIQFFK